MSKIEDIHLKKGYDLFMDELQYMTGESRTELWVINPEGKEVWWACARSEPEIEAAVQRAVKKFGK